jgi:hypothetical protein
MFPNLRKGGNCRRGLPEFPAEKPSVLAQTLEAAARGEHLFFERPRRRKPWSLISVRRTWPSRCTWATSAPRSSAIAWRARCGCSATASSPTTTSATGARSSGCCCSAGNKPRPARSKRRHRRMERLYKLINATECEANGDGPGAAAGTGETPERRRGKLKIWREMIALSQKQFDEIYGRSA